MGEYYTLKIKHYRILNRLTQKELASKIGISQNYLSDIENGRYDIGLSLLCKIADVLKVHPFDLVDFTYNTDTDNRFR